MAASLEQRFIRFLGGLEGAENLDILLSQDTERADFLLGHRQIILEIKSLETDPEYKVHDRLREHENRPEYPLFYWPAEVSEILAHLPDGDRISATMFNAVTNSIERGFKKADDQVAATRAELNLPNACGVLTLLNESLGVLTPEAITAKVSQMFNKRGDGNFRYREIAFVWVISESHGMPLSNGLLGLPIIVIEGPCAEAYPQASQLLDHLQQAWAEYKQVPLYPLGEQNGFEGISFGRRDQLQAERQPPRTNQEAWRTQYLATPYLASLSKEDFLAHAARIFGTMMPHFLVGGRKLASPAVRDLQIGWAHILVEAERRRLNMKEFSPYVHRAFEEAGISPEDSPKGKDGG